MLVPRCRNLISIKNSVVASTSATAQSAGFHSTPFACQKWKYKWDSDFGKGQQTKSYIRYSTRQKRADAKKALKDLLLRSGSSRVSFQDEDPIWKLDGTEADGSGRGGKKARAKHSSRHDAKKNHYKKMKQKIRRESFTEDFEGHPETVFHATFGNRWYTWAFNSDYSSTFENPAFGFKWREQTSSGNQRESRWESISDMESDDEEDINIGSSSDRMILGLPLSGPLKMEDIKSAFRLAALKWHPDKHPGPSQSMAEEKFKSCVNAYKSLCSALSAA